MIKTFFSLIIFLKIAICKIKGRNLTIGKRTNIHPFSSLIPSNGLISIGENCIIHKGVILASYNGEIRIGDNVSINPYCVLYGHGGLTIGNNVRIATHVIIIPANHIYEDACTTIREQGFVSKGIVIGSDVWIGAGAQILDGVNIADGCVIGAGSIVTKNTEKYSVYVGVPARKIKERRQ